MKSHFLVVAAVASSVAFAQVQVKSGDKTVEVGAGGDLTVKKGGKNVKVKTTGATTTVEGTTAAGETKTVDVQTGAGATTVKSGDQTVQVNAAGTTVTDGKGNTITVENTGTGPAPTLADGVWTVTGQGRSGTHVCGANEEVRISGQGHTLTLTGPCKSVLVSGQSNNIATDTAETILVSGMSNQVSWKSGPGGKKPKISVSGMGNSAPQLK
ncbi:MAG: DUF3060 domain-containing protein [Myxococcota bacterium]